MDALHTLLRTTHIAAGAVGLVAFWIPVFARKGSRPHVAAGRLFVWCLSLVVASALASCAWAMADPGSFLRLPPGMDEAEAAAIASRVRGFMGFLAMLAVLVLASSRLGTAALALRRDPTALATRELSMLHLVLLASSLFVLGVGLSTSRPVFAALSLIGVINAWEYFKVRRNPLPTRMAWWYHHMGAMLGTGIAFHTAVAVTTAGRLLGIPADSAAAILPWIVPSAIGVPAIAVWTGYYRRRFREMPAPRTAAATIDTPLRG